MKNIAFSILVFLSITGTLHSAQSFEYLVIDLDQTVYLKGDQRATEAANLRPEGKDEIFKADMKLSEEDKEKVISVTELNHATTLNVLGKKGWELVAIYPKDFKLLAYFKRPSRNSH